LKEKPEQYLLILDKLKSDKAKYVQDSVGNWLNDASKTRPDFVTALCERWENESPTKETKYIIKKALRPVAKISDTATEIQKNGDFSKRIEIDDGQDEIHKMANAFNEMLNSLENFYLREKQFSSDVSHELRTPVSVILTESQYSLDYADTMEEAKDSFSVIQRQAKRMSELINQIMELSKIEKQIGTPSDKINLSETVEKILGDYKNLFVEKNIEMTKEIEENEFDIIAKLFQTASK